MSFKILISVYAETDIFDAVLWYEEQLKGLSESFEKNLENGLESIKNNPYQYQIRYKNVRVHFINRFPYSIYYKIVESKIKVIAVYHTSRDPRILKNRN